MRKNENALVFAIIAIALAVLLFTKFIDPVKIQKEWSKKEKVKEEVKEDIQYTNGVVLEKTFDLYRETKTFVYRNSLNKIFVVRNPEFWSQVTIGDSIRIGFIENEVGKWNYSLEFISVEVLGKAKSSELDFEIITTPNRSNINHIQRVR